MAKKIKKETKEERRKRKIAEKNKWDEGYFGTGSGGTAFAMSGVDPSPKDRYRYTADTMGKPAKVASHWKSKRPKTKKRRVGMLEERGL